jgi:hypothetical protein
MKKYIFTTSLLLGLATAYGQKPQAEPAASQPSTNKSISFTEARNYFVKNTVKNLKQHKIDNTKQFESIFGAGAYQGPEGVVTAIDFSKSYVVALAFPKNNRIDDIKIIGVERQNAKEISVKYQLVYGKKRSYVICPSRILILDKKELGKIVLQEIKSNH